MWFGGGVRYHIYENVCHFTLAYNRQHFPDKDETTTNDTNQITFQAQFYYY